MCETPRRVAPVEAFGALMLQREAQAFSSLVSVADGFSCLRIRFGWSVHLQCSIGRLNLPRHHNDVSARVP